jgi:hypothetical protein
MVRSDGETRQEWVDRNAPIGPAPKDPNGKTIYQKNTKSPWEAIDPEAGLMHPEASVRQASAAHLRGQKLRDLDNRIEELRIENTGTDKPSDREVADAQMVGESDPAAKKALEDHAAFLKRRDGVVKLSKERLALKNQDDETFSRSYLVEKERSLTTAGEGAEWTKRVNDSAGSCRGVEVTRGSLASGTGLVSAICEGAGRRGNEGNQCGGGGGLRVVAVL